MILIYFAVMLAIVYRFHKHMDISVKERYANKECKKKKYNVVYSAIIFLILMIIPILAALNIAIPPIFSYVGPILIAWLMFVTDRAECFKALIWLLLATCIDMLLCYSKWRDAGYHCALILWPAVTFVAVFIFGTAKRLLIAAKDNDDEEEIEEEICDEEEANS